MSTSQVLDHIDAKIAADNPYHTELIGGRDAGFRIGPDGASAYVTLRRPGSWILGPRRDVVAGTGLLQGATKQQALEVLEQVLLDALDDVHALSSK